MERDASVPVDVLIHTSAQGLPDLSRPASDRVVPSVPMAAFDAVFHSDGEGLKHFLVPEVG